MTHDGLCEVLAAAIREKFYVEKIVPFGCYNDTIVRLEKEIARLERELVETKKKLNNTKSVIIQQLGGINKFLKRIK
jgi:hypothetical protein